METVESLCNQLARSKLLAPDAVRTIHKRWKDEVNDGADDIGRFSKWLVSNGFITNFQFEVVQRNLADLLFLNDYKLVERIGQGRMAGVFKAIHKFGQIVAVKVLPPSKSNDAYTVARFQREARMAMRLKHANVVRTYQVGKTKGGLHYLVMEYLDGATLEDVLQQRIKLPVHEALDVVLQALWGLAHLDAEGLIHRDLKPGNLMLIPPPRETVLGSLVKMLDIGLGRALFDEGTPGDEVGQLTTAGALLGTPNYMAPEQARSAHSADIRADIYSVGCILYRCLTGQPPFQDASTVRIMVRHATEVHKPLREFLPDAPLALQQLIDTFLAKDPAQRYATPAAAAKAIVDLMDSTAPARPLAEAEAPMRSYLKWLEQAPANEEVEPAAAVSAPEPSAPAAPPPKPAPAPAKAAPPVSKPLAAPPKKPAAPAPSGKRPGKATGAKAAAVKKTSPAPAQRNGVKPRTLPAITRRDLIAGSIGATVMLLIVLALWAAWQWLF